MPNEVTPYANHHRNTIQLVVPQATTI